MMDYSETLETTAGFWIFYHFLIIQFFSIFFLLPRQVFGGFLDHTVHYESLILGRLKDPISPPKLIFVGSDSNCMTHATWQTRAVEAINQNNYFILKYIII